MPQSTFSGEYSLPKRNRNEEEKISRQRDHQPWTKSILNMEENKFLGHTPTGWLLLILFYMIFAFVLTIFVVAYYYIFSKSILPNDKPMYDRGQPGISSAPHPGDKKKIEYNEDDEEEIRRYSKQIESFLKLKKDSDSSRFTACNSDSFYGYRTRQPCIFVKLNRALNFQFESYKNQNELPKHAPPDLKSFMEEQAAKKGGNDEDFNDRIWLSCENSDGSNQPEFQYIPHPYWDVNELAWDKSTKSQNENKAHDVQKRIIAVKLVDTPVDDDVNVLCTVWAQNMKIDCSIHGAGWIKFNLKINEGDVEKNDDQE